MVSFTALELRTMLGRNILITGANRGLGLEMVKQLANAAPEPSSATLIATCRQPTEAKELNDLAAKHHSILVKRLDVSKFESFSQFTQSLNVEESLWMKLEILCYKSLLLAPNLIRRASI